MLTLTVQGTLLDARIGRGLSGFHVQLHDKKGEFEKLLPMTATDSHGRFAVKVEGEALDDLLERRPDLLAEVFAPDGVTQIHEAGVVAKWRGASVPKVVIEVPPEASGRYVEEPRLVLTGDDGLATEELEVGDSLLFGVRGLRPVTPYEVVLGEGGNALLTSRLITDRFGAIEATALWPQLGLDDLEQREPLPVEKALGLWGGRALDVDVRLDGESLARGRIAVAQSMRRPMLLPTTADGILRNAIEAGRDEIVLSGFNVAGDLPVRIFMVGRQQGWAPGDRFRPVRLDSGRPAFVDVEPQGERFQVRLARRREVPPGAYDFIARPLRYGYEDDEDLLLRPSDIVACRTVTGLVARLDFWKSKAVRGGCVNFLPVSGRTVIGAPYFQYTDVFQVGEDVYGALDPAALDPNHEGKMVSVYVVQHKGAAGWSADKSLDHLPVLGGNPGVQTFKTQSGCVNYNKRLLWPNASITGEYDIVCDFGNNSPNPATFTTDANFDTPLDLIDGYFVAGFRVVPDPTVDTSFAHAGQFAYDQTTEGTVNVAGDFGSNWNVPLKARVYFPADAPGATTPAQISAAQPNYPLVVIVHGNSSHANSFEGYNYLLEHLARNGMIAASVHCQPGQYATDRARVLLAHVNLLKAKFGAKAQNNIGIMGHSRGGEAVMAACRLNHNEGLGHQFNAVISLAPSDWILHETFSGAWVEPLLVVYGAMDGDITGGPPAPQETGFAIYDRAAGMRKSMVFCYGAIHDRFNTVWGDGDLYFGNIGPTDLPKIVTADAHEKVAKGYMTAFFRQHLRGEAQWEGLFRGEWKPAAAVAADPKLKLYVQYADTTVRVVDDFEGAHTPTSWQSSTIGAVVDDGGTLPVDPTEDELYDVDAHSPHQTSGLSLRWDGSGDRLRFDVPPPQKNVSGFQALAFRVTQKANSPSNPAGPQDLYVTMRDITGKERAVKVGKFADIPEPQKRHYDMFTKSAMRTVRLPLHVFTIECAGMDEIDLKKVDSVRFDFGAVATGELAIDGVEFTN